MTAYQSGEIDYLTLIQSLEQAKSIETTQLENINHYNNTAVEIIYFN